MKKALLFLLAVTLTLRFARGVFLGLTAVNLVIGFSVTSIDNAAHIGGLLTGLLFGALIARWLPRDRKSAVVPARAAGRIDSPVRSCSHRR